MARRLSFPVEHADIGGEATAKSRTRSLVWRAGLIAFAVIVLGAAYFVRTKRDGPRAELGNPPGGLSLQGIAINPARIPVGPSGTTYAGRSITLSYADGTGRLRLWLSQSVEADPPHVPGNPLPFGQKGSGVTHYAWYAGDWGIDGFLGHQADRGFYLTAESGPDLTLDTITQTVGILAGVSSVRS